MPDKVDIESLTRAAESGQGCTILDVLSNLSLTDQFRALKQMQASHQEHRKQNSNVPELGFETPHIDGRGYGESYNHVRLWKVNPGVAIDDEIFSASGYVKSNQIVFSCTNLNSDGSQTRKVTKPLF